jgi:hypothetical protein
MVRSVSDRAPTLDSLYLAEWNPRIPKSLPRAILLVFDHLLDWEAPYSRIRLRQVVSNNWQSRALDSIDGNFLATAQLKPYPSGFVAPVAAGETLAIQWHFDPLGVSVHRFHGDDANPQW